MRIANCIYMKDECSVRTSLKGTSHVSPDTNSLKGTDAMRVFN